MDIIKSTKYHTIFFVKRYILPFKKENVTKISLLSAYLSLSNAKYKTSQEFTKFLDKNYGIYPIVRVVAAGDYHMLVFTMTAIHPKWINEEEYSFDLLKDTFKLMYESPNVANDSFDEEMLLLAKNELYTVIAEYNYDKQKVATRRAIANFLDLGLDELFGFCNKQELDAITTKDLYKYYQEVIKSPSVFQADGDLNNELNELKTSEYFLPSYLEKRRRINYLDDIIEYEDIKQTYLRVILEGAPFYDEEEKTIKMSLANYIFGGASTSLLFLTIREELGLCYDISSIYYSDFGFVMIACGISNGNENEAIEAIKKEIDNIKNGNISDNMLRNLKNKLINSIKSNLDSRNHAVNEQFKTKLYPVKFYTSEEKIRIIKDITIEDIKDVFKDLRISYVYQMKEAVENED